MIESEYTWDDFRQKIENEILCLSENINFNERAWAQVKRTFEEHAGGLAHPIKIGFARDEMNDWENPALKQSGYTLTEPAGKEVCYVQTFALVLQVFSLILLFFVYVRQFSLVLQVFSLVLCMYTID